MELSWPCRLAHGFSAQASRVPKLLQPDQFVQPRHLDRPHCRQVDPPVVSYGIQAFMTIYTSVLSNNSRTCAKAGTPNCCRHCLHSLSRTAAGQDDVRQCCLYSPEATATSQRPALCKACWRFARPCDARPPTVGLRTSSADACAHHAQWSQRVRLLSEPH